jgi:hypothetical protein
MDVPVPTQPAEVVHGLPPEGDLTSMTVNQGYPDTCAIRSQEIILRDFGIDVPQEQLMQEAAEHGWYTSGGGTPESDVGKLLELHGVGVTRYENANVYNLVSDLSAGKRIIVGVDSGELWNPGEDEKMEDEILGPRPDHALIVAGVDTTDPDNVTVVLTDPGTGHVAKEYPLAQFMDAWQDSGCEMICTNAPAPVTAPGMANFDYELGHLPVGDMAYSDWAGQYAHLMEPASYVSPFIGGDLFDTASIDIGGCDLEQTPVFAANHGVFSGDHSVTGANDPFNGDDFPRESPADMNHEHTIIDVPSFETGEQHSVVSDVGVMGGGSEAPVSAWFGTSNG